MRTHLRSTPALTLILASAALIIYGCATYSQLFVNADGQVMRCSATGQGIIGMAVASNAKTKCDEDMRSAGYIEIEKAGAIGITLSQTTPDTIARIIKIFDKSPALKRGLKVGDIIKKIDNNPVASAKDARIMMFDKAGTAVWFTVLRDTTVLTVTLTRLPYTAVFGTPTDATSSSGTNSQK